MALDKKRVELGAHHEDMGASQNTFGHPHGAEAPTDGGVAGHVKAQSRGGKRYGGPTEGTHRKSLPTGDR